ncbi:MAG: hypothetical protein HRU16_09005 [Planctomycetes bacterium]|nr:hypothetical protein [Planctomycetota bacterium]
MNRVCTLFLAMLLLLLTGSTVASADPITPLDEDIEQQVITELERGAAEEDQVRYRGQYRALIPLGPAATQVLLKMLRDEDLTLSRRRRAANALHDVATAELVEPLQQAMGDLLLEPWVETEMGLLLARLGERRFLERWLQQLRRITDRTPTTVNLAQILEGLARLGDLQFRSDDLAAATATHQRRITLLQDLIGRVHSGLQDALKSEMWAIHYNLACCLARRGETEGAFEALEKSLRSETIRISMAAIDGDLKSLRDDPRWSAWYERHKTPAEPPEAQIPAPGNR